jgi:RNA polymerase sigma-70 factor (ECF subfamily)
MSDSAEGTRDSFDADAELDFEAFQSGDLDSLRKVLAHFSPLIESVAASYAFDQSDRDDLFQRICIRMWERRMQFTGRGSLRGWINKVASSVCSNWAKERKTRRKDETRYISEVVSLNGAHDPDDPLENLQRTEFLARLRHCLARLPKRQGDTFLLVHLEGYRTAEVARIQEVRPETVRSNLRHARKRLSIMMKDYRE